MKIAAVIAILSFTAVQAAAVADKREADPRKSHFRITSCGLLGNSCAREEKREAEPEARKSSFRITSCGLLGNSCARDADADARKSHFTITSCGILGNSCARDASPDQHKFVRSACSVPGNSCSVAKRAALAVADALADARKSYFRITSCGLLGNSCAKARRDLNEVGSLTEGLLDKVLAIDEDDEAIAKRNAFIGHQFPRIHKDDGAFKLTGNAKRSVDLLNEEFPTVHTEECFEEGGECNTIALAHAAFHAVVKREADARIRITSCGILGNSCARDAAARIRITSCGILGNSCARDTEEALDAKLEGSQEYQDAEKECYAEGGECAAADKYLAELEEALNKANEATVSG